MMELCYPETDIVKLENHIFRMYDKDGDGWIDFKEFMMILYIMSSGTPEENLGQIFRIFDKDNDGTITQHEMTKIVKDLFNLFKMPNEDKSNDDKKKKKNVFKKTSSEEMALMAFKEMDKDLDGKVTKDEFIRACYQEESISNLFALKIVDLFIAKQTMARLFKRH